MERSGRSRFITSFFKALLGLATVAAAIFVATLAHFAVIGPGLPLAVVLLLAAGLTLAIVAKGLRGKGWRPILALLAFWAVFGLTQTFGLEDTAASSRGVASDGTRFHRIVGGTAPAQVGGVFWHLLSAAWNRDDSRAPRLCLDSHGGDAIAGLAMAEVVDLFGNTEVVTRRCESACVYVLAAAAQKTLVGREATGSTNYQVVGLHRTRAQRRLPVGRRSTEASADWFTDMGVTHLRRYGVSEQLTQALLATPPHGMHHPALAVLLRGNLADRALRPTEWRGLCGGSG